jgi:hypothetical protein
LLYGSDLDSSFKNSEDLKAEARLEEAAAEEIFQQYERECLREEARQNFLSQNQDLTPSELEIVLADFEKSLL